MVGEYIRSLRASAGLTQRQLAKDAGISASMLSHIEAGRREPTLNLLREIARALEIPSAALFAVALEDGNNTDSPEFRKLQALNAELLSAVQHSIVLRRLKASRERS